MADKIKIADVRAKFPMYADLSDDQLLIGIRNKYYPDIPMGEFSKRIEYTPIDAAKDMSGLDKFRAGVGKAFSDVGTGAQQIAAGAADFVNPKPQSRVNALRSEVAETRARDSALMNTGAGFAGNLAGNVAMFAPTAAIPGANTITGGALTGAMAGVLQPSASSDETRNNILFGAGAGAIVPAAATGYRTGKAALEPFYEAGRNRIVGRALDRAAGSDAPAVANRLRQVAEPFIGPSQGTPRTMMGEFVPGSIPTVGQAAENAGIASLERAATAANPDVTNAVSGIMQGQQAARRGVIQEMAGTGGQREFYSAARDATANQLYGEARRLGIDPSVLTPEVMQNISTFSKRVPQEVLNQAKKLAQINGEPMTNANSIQGMHWVKMAIDDLIGAADRAGNGTLKRAYVGLQKDLLSGMDNLSPAYQTARKTYEAMSRPINQMDVAQEIGNRSIDKVTGNLQPRAFANALSDQTAARATGLPSATLERTMDPAQLNALQSVLLDIQRSTAAQNMGRGAGSDTVQKLAYSNIIDQAGVPTFLRDMKPAQMVGGLTGRAADALYARQNRELSQRLAEVMLNPELAAELMSAATPRAANPLGQLLLRGGSGAALSAPAIANSQKQ